MSCSVDMVLLEVCVAILGTSDIKVQYKIVKKTGKRCT